MSLILFFVWEREREFYNRFTLAALIFMWLTQTGSSGKTLLLSHLLETNCVLIEYLVSDRDEYFVPECKEHPKEPRTEHEREKGNSIGIHNNLHEKNWIEFNFALFVLLLKCISSLFQKLHPTRGQKNARIPLESGINKKAKRQKVFYKHSPVGKKGTKKVKIISFSSSLFAIYSFSPLP